MPSDQAAARSLPSFTAVQLKRGEGLLFGPSESDVKPSALPELATASEIVLQKPIFRKRC
jgi:hypothetical protein